MFGIQFVFFAKYLNRKTNSKLIFSESLVLKFSRQEFLEINWTEENSEFIIGNHHFDVLSINFSSDNSCQIVCSEDKNENILFSVYNKFVDFFINSFTKKNLPIDSFSTFLLVQDYILSSPVDIIFMSFVIRIVCTIFNSSDSCDFNIVFWHPPKL